MSPRLSAGSRLLAAVVFVCLLSPCLVCTAVADSGASPSVAPANPRLIQYVQDLEAGKVEETTEDGHALGLVPIPVKPPQPVKKQDTAFRVLTLETTDTQSLRGLVGLPATYDLRPENKLTSVKNQGTCGNCWSFATYGSMESCLMPGETWDFSENHMKDTSGFDPTCCAGGNHYMSTAYLARWDGPGLELDDPFNAYSCESPPIIPVQKHIQSVDFIPDRTGSLDNDAIKQAVMTYGAVYTTFYWSGAYYNASTYSYCYNGSTVANHAVCIVGWDDSYSRYNFLTAPAGDGAFIIKNSWGPSWGQSGYFYMSYYDTKVGLDNAVFQNAESTTNYARNYQYDPLGWTESVGYGTNTAWCANVFSALADEQLVAVSLYGAMPGTSYELKVYLDPVNGPLNESGPSITQTGTLASAGYQTIPLSTTVPLDAGLPFSIVAKLTTPGFNYPIPMESPVTGYSSLATAIAGQSWISADGVSWGDLTTFFANANACLKAFTVDRTGLLVTPATGFFPVGPSTGPFTPSSQTYTLQNLSADNVEWSASKNEPWLDISNTGGTLAPNDTAVVTVSVNSEALSLGEGTYPDVVSFTNMTSGEGSTTRQVSLTVRDGTLSVAPATAMSCSGPEGGPFTPQAQVYTLTNTGYSDVSWTASKTQAWVGLSSESGTLAPGQSANVTVSILDQANAYEAGEYYDAVAFANTTNGRGDTYRNVTLSVVRNYTIADEPYSWIDPSSHGTLLLSDDGVSAAQTIPFTFSFYGTVYNQVYVGANGLIGFINDDLSEYLNTSIPYPDTPNQAVYPYWDDLNPSAAGSVRIGTVGTYPNRKLVISWVGVPHYESAGPLTFQVMLCETTSDIVLQYQEVQPGDSLHGAGRSATIGVERVGGTVARQYSFNGSVLLENSQAIRLSPNRWVTIPQAIRLPNGVSCAMSDVLVTAVISASQFYIEADDRAAGMSVYRSGHGLLPGDRAEVYGIMSTSSAGEKYMNAGIVAYTGGDGVLLRPVVLTNRAVGGGDCCYDPVTKAGQEGVKDQTRKGIEPCPHVNNVGLLITTTGIVTYSTTGYFYIDDGSGAQDESPYKGVKVLGTVPVGQGEDPVGRYVIVTGISSTFKATAPATDLYRQIRATDIVVVD